MTYHIDIINLCFEYLHQNTHKKSCSYIKDNCKYN